MSIEMTDAIAQFFVYLGGNPERAIQEAKAFDNVKGWVTRQRNLASWMGAMAMLVPFLHAPAMIIDTLYLFRKMTYVCWGVAAIRGCQPSGTADFKIILAHWSGAIGDEMLDAAIIESTNEFNESTLISSIADQVFILLISRYGWRGTRSMVVPPVIKGSGKVASKLTAKITLKYFAKVGVKLVASIMAGFLPLIGVVVAVGLNRYFVDSIAKSADRYYSALQKYREQNSWREAGYEE